MLDPRPPMDCPELLIPPDCFENRHTRIRGFIAAELCQQVTSSTPLIVDVEIELNWTVWKALVLPHSGYDNENDPRLPRGRAPKRLRRSVADGRRSRAHPAVEPWPPSHSQTAQAGIAIHGRSRAQSEKDRGTIPGKTTHRAEDSDESPQGGVNGVCCEAVEFSDSSPASCEKVGCRFHAAPWASNSRKNSLSMQPLPSGGMRLHASQALPLGS